MSDQARLTIVLTDEVTGGGGSATPQPSQSPPVGTAAVTTPSGASRPAAQPGQQRGRAGGGGDTITFNATTAIARDVLNASGLGGIAESVTRSVNAFKEVASAMQARSIAATATAGRAAPVLLHPAGSAAATASNAAAQAAMANGTAVAGSSALSRLASVATPATIAIGAVTAGFYVLAKATKALYDWMERSTIQLEKWNGALATANARAEIIRMETERRRAGQLGDELGRFSVAKARTGSVLSDIFTDFIEPFAGIMASVMEIAADISEIVKPIHEITKWINPIYLTAQGINFVLEKIRDFIRTIKEWLVGRDNGDDQAFNDEIRKLDALYDSLRNYPWRQPVMPPNVSPGQPFGGLI